MTVINRVRAVWQALVSGDGAEPSQAAALQVRVSDEDAGWIPHGHAPGDRPWADVYADLEDALEAWRKNMMVRRVVNLTRSYVVGGGITFDSDDADVGDFIAQFWAHPRNRIAQRLGPICDTLTRDGEVFPILFTNPVDGMSYLRFKTARQIMAIETDPEDYETELAYIEITSQATLGAPVAADRRWIAPRHPTAWRSHRSPAPLMLHWAINKPVDATRGESDLTPILPWALRYAEWLKDRVRLNRQRTRAALLDIALADDAQVETKRQQLRRTNPIEAGIYVHGPGETLQLHNLQIRADDAEKDGRVLRLAIATGANLGLHYLGEGEGTNYATAREMGEPTARFYADRQQELLWMLEDLLTVAYYRYRFVTTGAHTETDLQLRASVSATARADNAVIAHATYEIVQALALASAQGWIDDLTALTLALKFAGETMSGDQVRQVLRRAREELGELKIENG